MRWRRREKCHGVRGRRRRRRAEELPDLKSRFAFYGLEEAVTLRLWLVAALLEFLDAEWPQILPQKISVVAKNITMDCYSLMMIFQSSSNSYMSLAREKKKKKKKKKKTMVDGKSSSPL
ncbi:hypothetical protein B296_00043105 [Ensete ventricosum]|uniref:Uncharacterized protein n=1 Tax=Ensete ventricosum TaxID=4639 RepID=A0A426XUC0_ENSVE|nr:hypothetical protein B296_00043105 [Ensete ventricosum]